MKNGTKNVSTSTVQPRLKRSVERKFVIAIMILAIIAGIWIYAYLNWPQDFDPINVMNRKKLMSSNSLIYPGAKLTAVNKNSDGTATVSYDTHGGNVLYFYTEQLKRSGWSKIAELGAEDATLCGGDRGGIYEKGSQKFKLHICGPNSADSLLDIDFDFYNIEPEKVLGTDLSGGTLSCVTDATKIDIISACATQDTLKLSFKIQHPELDSFGIVMTGEKNYIGSSEVDAIDNKSTLKEVNIHYDIAKYGPIKKVEISSVYCNNQVAESDVKTCN